MLWDPSFMVKSYWVVVVVVGGWVAYRILVSAPVPLVLIRVLNWVGVGPRGFED